MERIKSQLKRRNFRFKSESEDSILVRLGFGLNCRVKSGQDGDVEVTGHLSGWNFATGVINVNMKWLMAYNLALLFIVLGVIMYLKPEPFISPFFYDFFLSWFVLSNIYYLIRFHYFKLVVYSFL